MKTKTHKNALKYLDSIIASESHEYKEPKKAHYLCSTSDKIQNLTAKFFAKVQSHMIETVKINFQGYFKPNVVWNSCNSESFYQSHLMYCKH